ncbi:acetyltransferase [Solibacillus ferritrahens]|uniref:acetyltransferase n=1 Tax=Solibacillus ferritrahens TaxID=3098620 RepID=UPI00300AAEBD
MKNLKVTKGDKSMKKFILIGDSGHSKVIQDCIMSNGDIVIAKLDDKYSSPFKEGPFMKGPISFLESIITPGIEVIIAIGHNTVRKKLSIELAEKGIKFGTIIHKKAIISPSAIIGVGSVAMPGSVVNADAVIGNHVIINSNCTIEHDCIVRDYSHVSPNAVLTGNVKVGEGCHIGAGSNIIPSVIVGDWSIIGAGSTVIENISNNVTAVGSPAKEIRKKDS